MAITGGWTPAIPDILADSDAPDFFERVSQMVDIDFPPPPPANELESQVIQGEIVEEDDPLFGDTIDLMADLEETPIFKALYDEVENKPEAGLALLHANIQEREHEHRRLHHEWQEAVAALLS